MKRRRALLFFGGLLVVLAVAAVLLRRDLEAAYYVHRLHHAKEWRDRANAAIELARLKVRRTASDLVKRLQDPSREVRKNCEWALAEVTGWPWGIDKGPAPAWWNKYGKDFVAGREVPPLPRVALPEPTGEGTYLEITARLEEDRVYRLGPTDDMITVVVTFKNKTGQTITVLHPPWEAYEAYRYAADGVKTPVDVRLAPPSSILFEATRTGRTLSGQIETPTWEFSVLPDEIPPGESVETSYPFVVSREGQDILFQTYTFDVRVNDAVLGTPQGLVTERDRAPTLRAYAWAGGKEVLEQLGMAAQEVAKSGRDVEGVVWATLKRYGEPGTLDRPCSGFGSKPLFPIGELAWSKVTGWVKVEHEAHLDAAALSCGSGSPGPPQEDWIFVVKGQ